MLALPSSHGGTGPIAGLCSRRWHCSNGGLRLELRKNAPQSANPRLQRIAIIVNFARQKLYEGAFFFFGKVRRQNPVKYRASSALMNSLGSGALPNRRPYLEPEDDERRGAENDAERRPREFPSRRKPGLKEFEIVGDRVQVAAGLIDLSQRELAFV